MIFAKLIQIIKKVWSRLTHEDINLTAAALSYTTVLSLVPILAVLLALMTKFDYYGQVAPQVEKVIVKNFSETAGAEGVRLIQKAISRIQNGTLGTFGALILILIVTRTMLSLDRAIHRIWQVKNNRKLVHQFFVYWAFVIVIPILLGVWIYTMMILKSLGYSFSTSYSGYALVFAILFLIQRYLPSFEVQFLPVLTGTLVSMVLLFGLTRGFAYLTAGVYRYSKIYGSLAAVPTFLLWIYLIWLSVLLGTAVSAMASRSKA
ncbi:MAG: YihY/virulence factor BrkB family protein [Pseudobdellovibrionaceae bacterium]